MHPLGASPGRCVPWDEASGREGDIVHAVGWVDRELSSRLANIDRKLDHLSQQVSGYHSCVKKVLVLPAVDRETVGQCSTDREDATDSVPLTVRLSDKAMISTESTTTVHEAWASPTAKALQERSRLERQISMHSSRSKNSNASADRKRPQVDTKETLEASWLVPSKLAQQAMVVRLVMDDPEYSTMGRWYSILMPSFVICSILPSMVMSAADPPMSSLQYAVVEVVIEFVFLVDVALRFIVAPSGRAFFRMGNNLIDILVVLPFVLRAAIGFALEDGDLETMPGSMLLYIVPLLRLLKSLRGFRKFSLVLNVAAHVYVDALPTIFMLVYLVLIFATLVFYIEPRSNIETYGKAIWFVCVTMTTVGYGDISPTSTLGYMLAAVMVCSSVFVMAMPLGIIGSAVSEIWKDRDTIILRKWAKERLDQWGYTATDIPQFFDAFDTDNSGALDFDEFCSMVDEMKVDIKLDRLNQLFKSFDDDGSGLVDAREFVRMLYPAEYEELFGRRERENKLKSKSADLSPTSQDGDNLALEDKQACQDKMLSINDADKMPKHDAPSSGTLRQTGQPAVEHLLQ
jgi:voltage-gated potassium channel Kch